MAINFELGEGWGDRVALGLIILQADETLEQEFRLLMSSDVFSLYHSLFPIILKFLMINHYDNSVLYVKFSSTAYIMYFSCFNIFRHCIHPEISTELVLF